MPGFLVAVCLFAIFINGAMLYRHAPAVAAPVASWLDPNKLQDRMTLTLPPCSRIRKDVVKYGIDVVIAEAKRRGFSEAQINEAKNCLTKGERS